jgi:MFS family permease
VTEPDRRGGRDHRTARERAHPSRLHYGWVVAIVGVLVVMCGLGFGRFAFGMLLPSMGDGLGLSYREMGLISTANFVGYLGGALVAGSLSGAIGTRRLIPIALATIAVSLMVISVSSSFWSVLVLFTVTGVGSGCCNVAVVGLVSHWFHRGLRGRASGVVVSGSGYGIMLTGVLIPVINSAYGADGWRIGWFALAAIVAVVAVLGVVFLRNYPADMGLSPAGEVVEHASHHAPASPAAQRRATWHLGAIYFMFGFSYVIYVTFIVTTLVEDRGFRESSAGWFWFAFGFFSIFSGPLFGWLSDRLSRRIGLASVFAFHTVAFALLGVPVPTPFLYLSVVLFGLSAWSIPGIMGAAVGDFMGPHQAVRTLGILTLFFGVGQAVGPALAGVLADRSGSFASSYLVAAAFAACGGALSLLLRPGPRIPVEQ